VKMQKPDWNEIDLTFTPPVNRVSHMGIYQVVDGLPRYELIFALSVSLSTVVICFRSFLEFVINRALIT
jgi:hypothetical protein